MRDMFYNYDNEQRRKHKTYPDVDLPEEYPDTLTSYNNSTIAYDVRGNEIGIRAYAGTDIRLYFSFSGNVNGKNPIEFLNKYPITISLLDFFNRVAYSKQIWDPQGKPVDEYGVLEVILPAFELANANIRSDTYKIKMVIDVVPENNEDIEPEEFVLFAGDDAVLNII